MFKEIKKELLTFKKYDKQIFSEIIERKGEKILQKVNSIQKEKERKKKKNMNTERWKIEDKFRRRKNRVMKSLMK